MKKLSHLLTYPLINGIVFAAGSALIVYVTKSDSIIFIQPLSIYPNVIFSVVAFLLLALACYLFTRRLDVASLMASFLVLGLFYLLPLFIAIGVILLASLVSVRVIRHKVRFRDAHLVLNVVSIAIVCYYLVRFIGLFIGLPWSSYRSTIQPIQTGPVATSSQGTRPDIYYIILDAYGRSDVLQSIHGFDNSAFVDALAERGFVVASRSQANYPRTLLSLSSSMNMQYLNSMSSVMGDSSLWWPVMDAIHHSEIRSILQDQGYQTVFFASNWDFTDIRDGDYYEAPAPIMLKDFDNQFLNFTNLHFFQWVDKIGVNYPSYSTHRKGILFDFAQLPKVARLPGPKFVFAHIISPHAPYVFDRSGNPLDPDYPYSLLVQEALGATESRSKYLDQVMFVNQEILKAVDGILANSSTPPVIILQADHGPGIFFNASQLENNCLLERYSILNAYYLPGVRPDSIPPDISPVNTFRLVLNAYFQTSLEILPNRQYFSTSVDMYQMVDVTDRSQAPCRLDSASH
jgi:hypothetical protein